MDSWQIVENYRLAVLPPAHAGDEWLARTNGGTGDGVRAHGTGSTPEAAVKAAAAMIRRRARRRRVE